MLEVEQFVYTAASIDGNKGYQIVGKSSGVTPEIIAEIDGYFYPTDIDSTEFTESRSVLVLKNDFVVYSRITNVGMGYDGRDNTLYNHSFIVSKNTFESYGYDTRIFDEFYLQDQSIRGTLPTLTIDPPIPTSNETFSCSDSVLHEIFSSLFTNKKLALVFDDLKLPQIIIGFLPLSLRLFSFSTCVIDSKKQSKFDFILGKKLKKFTLDKATKIITKNESTRPLNSLFDKSISYYINILKSQNFTELEKINRSFDELSSGSNKNKLILLCNYSQFQNSEGNEKSMHTENVLKILKEFDSDTFSHYFNEIRKSVKKPININHDSDSVSNPYIAFLQICFYFPQKIMADAFNSVVGAKIDDD